MEHDRQCEALKMREALSKKLNVQEQELRDLYQEGHLCFCLVRRVNESWKPDFSNYQKQTASVIVLILKARAEGKKKKAGERLLPPDSLVERETVSRKDLPNPKNVIEIDFRNRRRLD